LGVAVDHDGLETVFAQRERGVDAAIVELDALTDPVRPAAENDDLLPRRRVRLALFFVRAVEIRRERLEFGCARIDALEGGDESLFDARGANGFLVRAEHASQPPGAETGA